jgi:hypothetical protein
MAKASDKSPDTTQRTKDSLRFKAFTVETAKVSLGTERVKVAN